jgi:hypothetical protein
VFSNYDEVSQEVQHEVQLYANTSLQPMIENEGLIDPLLNVIPVKKIKHVVDSFCFTYSVLLLSFLLVSGVWLVAAIINANDCESGRMINNVIAIFIFVGHIVLMGQMFTIRAQLMDTGQVGRPFPHLVSE